MLEDILENLVMQGLIKEMDISDFDSVSKFVLNLTNEAKAKIEANYILRSEAEKLIKQARKQGAELQNKTIKEGLEK